MEKKVLVDEGRRAARHRGVHPRLGPASLLGDLGRGFRPWRCSSGSSPCRSTGWAPCSRLHRSGSRRAPWAGCCITWRSALRRSTSSSWAQLADSRYPGRVTTKLCPGARGLAWFAGGREAEVSASEGRLCLGQVPNAECGRGEPAAGCEELAPGAGAADGRTATARPYDYQRGNALPRAAHRPARSPSNLCAARATGRRSR